MDQRLDELVGRALGVEWAPMTSGAMADYIGTRPSKMIQVAVLRAGELLQEALDQLAPIVEALKA